MQYRPSPSKPARHQQQQDDPILAQFTSRSLVEFVDSIVYSTLYAVAQAKGKKINAVEHHSLLTSLGVQIQLAVNAPPASPVADRRGQLELTTSPRLVARTIRDGIGRFKPSLAPHMREVDVALRDLLARDLGSRLTLDDDSPYNSIISPPKQQPLQYQYEEENFQAPVPAFQSRQQSLASAGSHHQLQHQQSARDLAVEEYEPEEQQQQQYDDDVDSHSEEQQQEAQDEPEEVADIHVSRDLYDRFVGTATRFLEYINQLPVCTSGAIEAVSLNKAAYTKKLIEASPKDYTMYKPGLKAQFSMAQQVATLCYAFGLMGQTDMNKTISLSQLHATISKAKEDGIEFQEIVKVISSDSQYYASAAAASGSSSSNQLPPRPATAAAAVPPSAASAAAARRKYDPFAPSVDHYGGSQGQDELPSSSRSSRPNSAAPSSSASSGSGSAPSSAKQSKEAFDPWNAPAPARPVKKHDPFAVSSDNHFGAEPQSLASTAKAGSFSSAMDGLTAAQRTAIEDKFDEIAELQKSKKISKKFQQKLISVKQAYTQNASLVLTIDEIIAAGSSEFAPPGVQDEDMGMLDQLAGILSRMRGLFVPDLPLDVKRLHTVFTNIDPVDMPRFDF